MHLFKRHIAILFMWLLAAVTPCVAAHAAEDSKFTVVIDAGHGGNDPGAMGKSVKEKTINLAVALKLGSLIEKNCKDVKVVYTRKTDVFIKLDRRAEIANNAKADLFISIHTNALAKNHTAKGASTWTLGLATSDANLDVAKRENAVILYEDDYKQRYAGFDPNSAESYIIFEFMQDKNMQQSVDFAKQIQRQFKTTARRVDSGVHQAGFLVLKASAMPSVLVELGFISTPEEERFLASEAGSQTMANSIFQAFKVYKRDHELKLQANNSPARPVINEEYQDEEVRPIANVAPPTSNRTETASNRTANNPVRANNAPHTADSNAAAATQQASTRTTTSSSKPAKAAESTASTNENNDNNAPVFKIQFLTAPRKLAAGDSRFKGLKPVDYYVDKGTYKYTYGASTDYNAVHSKFKAVTAKFKDAFIIAFKNGKRMDVNQAIKEFKANKNKK